MREGDIPYPHLVELVYILKFPYRVAVLYAENIYPPPRLLYLIAIIRSVGSRHGFRPLVAIGLPILEPFYSYFVYRVYALNAELLLVTIYTPLFLIEIDSKESSVEATLLHKCK